VGINGGYYQSIGGPHDAFLIFHEILIKGGRPSSKEIVNVGFGIRKGGISNLEIIFTTYEMYLGHFSHSLSNDFSDFYKIWLF
jgi:hypothetical protein